MSRTVDDRSLIERAPETRAIEDALDRAARGQGTTFVVEGEAGIGKSAILGFGRECAKRLGFAIVTVRGSELEQAHPFGMARTILEQLLGPAEHDDLFHGSAVTAATLLESAPVPDELHVADPSSTLHALYWVLVNASERQPLLVAADDIQWADAASMRFFAYLARRIADLPVVLLLAVRPGEAEAAGIVAAMKPEASTAHLRLRPLSERGVSALLLSESRGSELRAASVRRETGGIPFYIIELARAVDSAADVLRSGSVPDSIVASIHHRVNDPNLSTAAIAEAAAVLDVDASLRRIARVAGIPDEDASTAVRRLVERGVFRPDAVAFIHPIVRSAIYDAIPAPIRAEKHRMAAVALSETGAPIGAVASQLMRTEPSGDDVVCDTLIEAASAALAQGDPHGAATYLRRAAAEPPSANRLGTVLLELAQAESATGIPTAVDRYDDAVLALVDAESRARARLAQGHALIRGGRWQDAATAFEAGLAEVPESETVLHSQLEAGFVSSAFVGLVDHADAERRLARVLSAPLSDPGHRELAAWAAFQQSARTAMTAAEAAALVRRAVEGGNIDELVMDSQVIELAAGVFIATGDLTEEVALLDRGVEAAHRLGQFAKVAVYLYCRSLPNLLMGKLREAVADATTAVAGHEHGWDTFYPASCAALAWALLETGDLDAAAAAVAIDDEQWGQRLDFRLMVPIARGRVALAQDNLALAASHFEQAGAAAEAIGIRSSTILADWRTWYAVTLARLGRRDEALRVATDARDLAERWGAPIARARAYWATAVAAGGDGTNLLRDAIELLEPTEAALLELRARVELGAMLRRLGRVREARDELASAAGLAQRIGAETLGGRARSELVAAGLRPRRRAVTGVEALTASELRVVQMAAAGRTNRQIAQALFVTPKAIEFHLANAYRKLSVSGRTELATALTVGDAASIPSR